METSRARSLTIYRSLLDIRDLIELFPNALMRHQTLGLGRLSGSSFYPGDGAGTTKDTVDYVNLAELKMVLELAPGDYYTPQLEYQVIPSRAAAKKYAARFGDFFPDAPLGPSQAAVILRKEIREALVQAKKIDDLRAISVLKEIEDLLAAIDESRWADFKLPNKPWLAEESSQSLVQIAKHKMQIDALIAASDETSPLPNMLVLFKKSKGPLSNIDITEYLVKLTRCRLIADLALNEFDRADAGKSNNSHFISGEWYESQKIKYEIESHQQTKDRFNAIDPELGDLYMNDILIERGRNRKAIDHKRRSEIEAAILAIDKAVENRDLSSLLRAQDDPVSLAVNAYAKKGIEKAFQASVKKIRDLIGNKKFENARQIIQEISPHLVGEREEREIEKLEVQCRHAEKEVQESVQRRSLRRLEGALLETLGRIRFDIQSRLFKPTHSGRDFDDSSIQLILLWKFQKIFTPHQARAKFNDLLGQNDYDVATFWSARRAELSAVEYLSHFYGDAIDVSIKQLGRAESGWRTHDIESNEQFFDVKNARSSFSNEKNFSELCVPQFKKERQRNESVILLGVFSEYLSAWRINEGARSKSLILGFLSEEEQNNVSDCVARLTDGQLRLFFGSRVGRSERFLPGWMFEHPVRFYPYRREAIGRIRQVLDVFERHPELAEGLSPDFWLLQAVTSTGGAHACFPEHLNWIRPVVQVIKECGLKLRSLVLSVIVMSIHYADRVKEPFRPSDMKELFNPLGAYEDSPLGVYDPLGYVDTMIDVFDLIYRTNRDELSQYCEFSLSAEGILRGRKEGCRWETIIAYCGGRLESGVKCGKNPIHSGESDHCQISSCRKLVCPVCGFCSSGCEGQESRSFGLECIYYDPDF